MNTEIGANKAKKKLPKLLRLARAGRRFTITSRGTPIADLVPTAATRRADAGAAIDRFRAFMKDDPVKVGARVNVRALIEEGRE